MMGDLAKRRRSRDLRISWSHVQAGVVGLVFLLVTTFSIGVLVGQQRAGAAGTDVSYSLVGTASDESLLELLARVDATANPHAEVDHLTFPDELKAEEGAVAIPEAPASAGLDLVVNPSFGFEAPEAGAPPPGQWTVQVGEFAAAADASQVRDHLQRAGIPAWLSVVRVDGEARYQVGVGGFEEQSEGAAALGPVAEALATSPVSQGSPQVVELR